MKIEKKVKMMANKFKEAYELMAEIEKYYVDHGVDEGDFCDLFIDYIEHEYDYNTFLEKINKIKH